MSRLQKTIVPPAAAAGPTPAGSPAAARPTPSGVPIGPRVVRALTLAYRARRSALLEGPTGIGKSELVRQIAESLGIDYAVLDLSLLEPPDLVGLPVIADGRTSYATPSILPTGGKGILLLEELNRADRSVQQPALQLLTARRLHEYVVPSGWVVFAAINPEDGEYQVTPLDPALRSRFLVLKVRADVPTWRKWAASAGVHAAVLRLAAAHDDLFDTVPPRTWVYASELLHTLTESDREDEQLLADAIGGYLPPAWAKRLRDELEREPAADEVGGFDVRDLLAKYHKDATLRSRLQALRDGGQTDAFHRLKRRLLEVVDGPELLRLVADGAFSLDAFETLLVDLPGDHRSAIQKAAGEQPALAGLLPLKPEEVVAPQYATSARMGDVAAWANNPLKGHRVAVLVGAVAAWLDRHPDLAILRQKKGAMDGLTAFARQVRPRWSGPLDEVLKRHGLTV